MKARRVIITVEVETDKKTKELKELLKTFFLGSVVHQVQLNVIKKKC